MATLGSSSTCGDVGIEQRVWRCWDQEHEGTCVEGNSDIMRQTGYANVVFCKVMLFFDIVGKPLDVLITHTTYGLRVSVLSLLFWAGPGASRKAESAWAMHREAARGSEGHADRQQGD